jgi:hypothetical protein
MYPKFAPKMLKQHSQALRLDRLVGLLLLAIAAAGLPGCDEKNPTGTEMITSTEGAQAGVASSVVAADAAAASSPTTSATIGTLPLPLYQEVTSNDAPAFYIRQLGTQMSGRFGILNWSSKQPALFGQTTGSGAAVYGWNTGQGEAGHFEIDYGSNPRAAIAGITRATGSAAVFENTLSSNANPVLAVTNRGGGYAGVFLASSASGRGVLIQTQGGAGLQVAGGSKNAVVRTPSGAKALYTEESTEVWFTDYGFGRLANGRTRVLLDPSFAQTINPDEAYHVFLQARGRAELYVGKTTPLGFEVVLKDGDPNAEFSYRIVAKRLGFEQKRLEPAPWLDRLDGQLGQIR